jgi:hypothetical protein
MNMLKAIVIGAMLVGLSGTATNLPARTPPFSDAQLAKPTVTIEGMVVRFTFRDPHSVVYVMAPDENGTTVTWAVQWRAASALRAEDIYGNTLGAGDYVVITGNPARNYQSHRLRMTAIERPADGWMWVGVTVR